MSAVDVRQQPSEPSMQAIGEFFYNVLDWNSFTVQLTACYSISHHVPMWQLFCHATTFVRLPLALKVLEAPCEDVFLAETGGVEHCELVFVLLSVLV